MQCAGLMVQQVIDGPSVFIPALSFRQPFASLVLYGIKQLEARNRPTLKQMQGKCPVPDPALCASVPALPALILAAALMPGPLALHVSHREEPWNSPLLSAAVSLLRRRYSDESVCAMPAVGPGRGHGMRLRKGRANGGRGA